MKIDIVKRLVFSIMIRSLYQCLLERRSIYGKNQADHSHADLGYIGLVCAIYSAVSPFDGFHSRRGRDIGDGDISVAKKAEVPSSPFQEILLFAALVRRLYGYEFPVSFRSV